MFNVGFKTGRVVSTRGCGVFHRFIHFFEDFLMLKNVKTKLAAAFALGAASISSAFAATDVQAINDTVEDVTAVGAAVMGVLVAVAAVKYVRRAL